MTEEEEIVEPGRKKMDFQNVQKTNVNNNKWSNKEYLPNEELIFLQQRIQKYERKISILENEIKDLKK